MATYRIEYFDKNGHNMKTVKGKSIDAVRKSIANGSIGKLSGSGTTIYRTDVRKIQPGTWFKNVGFVYSDRGTVFYKTFPEGKTYRVSKTNGGLLDFDKYWRYI